MKCLACGVGSGPDAKFCPECGARMPKACSSCGTANPFDAKFCSNCGEPTKAVAGEHTRVRPAAHTPKGLWNISAEGERRHVTVLRSDLSGFSAMFEALDPEQVAEILQPILDISGEVIAGRGGLITQFRGDEIIALFAGAVSENS